MKGLIGFVSGLIFAIGLVVSGMTNPDKVIGFLDIFRNWDPALVFVMGGAVAFNLVTFNLVKKKKSKPVFHTTFDLPTKKDIDKKLVIGSTLFGIGWGIAGICPGPGIVNLSLLDPKAVVFVVSMLSGMLIFKTFGKRWS